jgi:hypothetical protein
MHDDPVICWVIPRPETRRRVLPRFFGAMIRHLYLPADEVYTTEDRDAAGLWLPPGNAAPATSDVLRGNVNSNWPHRVHLKWPHLRS